MPPVAESRLSVRADFPIFARWVGGDPERRPLVYLDSGASSQKPQVVIDALAEHLAAHNANVHRGVYPLAQEADAAFESARARIAAFTGAEPKTTIFTKNATEAINLVARAWGAAHLGPGDAVLITQMEHHANLVPWQQICRERGAELRYLEVDELGELSLAQLDAELATGDVRIVAFAHVSNVLGTINPVAEIAAAGPRGRRRDARGRRAGGAADARRRGSARRRLLRVDRPQGGRPDRHRRAARPARAARGDGPVPDGRRHDRLGGLAGDDVERAAVQVRSGHAADRRGRRPGRRRRLPPRSWAWRACESTSAS